MKILIIGCGSIGSRHAKNIATRKHELALFDVDAARVQALRKDVEAETVQSIAEGLALKPDAAFICTPPNLHVQQALACVRARVPVFIEKPLAHDLDDIDTLVYEARANNVATMVGCNLRFTEGLQKIKELLPRLGKLVLARAEFGYDLRKWRPGQDYRRNYAFSHEQGGGIVLDAIHELDYALWLFGRPIKGFGKVVRSGQLEIETEDHAEFILELEHCRTVSIHLDYLNPAYTRGCRVLGERGALYWDFPTSTVRALIDGKENFIQTNADINAMYVAEVDHFLNALQQGVKPMNPIAEAAETLRYALRLRDSGSVQ